MKQFNFISIKLSLVFNFILLILLITHKSQAQFITASYELFNTNTKGYASVLIPSSFPININDEEVMAVGSILDPNNPNATSSALNLVRYNNQGQIQLNKIIDDPNAVERAISICVYDPQTFVILSSYCVPGSTSNINKAKLTFVDINGQVLSEELLKIAPPVSTYDNVFPMHAIMYKNELYICGALQNGSSNVGLDFTIQKAGFVYNYNTQQSVVIESTISPSVSVYQFYTLAKRLRIVKGELFVLGMFDNAFTYSSGASINAPSPFFAKVNLPSLSTSPLSITNFKLLNSLMGCASDVLLSSNSVDFLVLSQGMTNQNTSSNPSALVTTTGVKLSYVNNTNFYTADLTQVDNQTATSMFLDQNSSNKIIIAGWEQRISSPIFPILGGNTNSVVYPFANRDNAFLFDIDYNYSSTSGFVVTVNDFSVFANLINNTQSYRDLGGPNMSNFYLLPDNAIQRDASLYDGYIINTLYKNKQPLSFYHGFKTIFTNHITSCDAFLNPYYQPTPFNIIPNSILLNNTIPTITNINIVNSLVSISNLDSLHSNVDICEKDQFYKIAFNNKFKNKISLYPNPTFANTLINIKLNDELGLQNNILLELKNIQGQTISSKVINILNNTINYMLPFISPGLYYINLVGQSGFQKVLPISIN